MDDSWSEHASIGLHTPHDTTARIHAKVYGALDKAVGCPNKYVPANKKTWNAQIGSSVSRGGLKKGSAPSACSYLPQQYTDKKS